MVTTALAGGTGNLGGRMLRELSARKASVIALVRPGTDKAKSDKLQAMGALVKHVDMNDAIAVAKAVEGAQCFVSAVAGLGDVIVETQSKLLEGCVRAGVSRFIPSDFAADINALPPGNNRNFDLRLAFQERLHKAAIKPTSIFNGCFAEVLAYGGPMLDPKRKTVGFWEDPDWHMEFTTMDDVAAYTAHVALDRDTPRALHIASFQASPKQLAECAAKISGAPFALQNMGSRDALKAANERARAADPKGEEALYPRWQQGQYMWSMTGTHRTSLDNARYADLEWAPLEDVLRHFLRPS